MADFYLHHNILTPKHVQAIGPAFHVFLWIASQMDDDGWVREGGEVTAAEIAEHIGSNPRRVRSHLKRLSSGGYIVFTGDVRALRIRLLRTDLASK